MFSGRESNEKARANILNWHPERHFFSFSECCDYDDDDSDENDDDLDGDEDDYDDEYEKPSEAHL